ncbi:unnamed protein product [Protopolystoma xenopodis]|uniref:Uncharacterized protein n=1 Tax=Protopolystoma xenopodis TaxID=117903 RepID=A0A3S5AD94_9PLAT|nr:unnamed protein product [Protopolystoma xenopodis]
MQSSACNLTSSQLQPPPFRRHHHHFSPRLRLKEPSGTRIVDGPHLDTPTDTERACARTPGGFIQLSRDERHGAGRFDAGRAAAVAGGKHTYFAAALLATGMGMEAD